MRARSRRHAHYFEPDALNSDALVEARARHACPSFGATSSLNHDHSTTSTTHPSPLYLPRSSNVRLNTTYIITSCFFSRKNASSLLYHHSSFLPCPSLRAVAVQHMHSCTSDAMIMQVQPFRPYPAVLPTLQRHQSGLLCVPADLALIDLSNQHQHFWHIAISRSPSCHGHISRIDIDFWSFYHLCSRAFCLGSSSRLRRSMQAARLLLTS